MFNPSLANKFGDTLSTMSTTSVSICPGNRQSSLLTSPGIARPPYISSRFILGGNEKGWWELKPSGDEDAGRTMVAISQANRVPNEQGKGASFTITGRTLISTSINLRMSRGAPLGGDKGRGRLEWNTERIHLLTTSVSRESRRM
ncbi:hypothetical protein TNIN_308141 [Trichonephila inaurata madagascariensis]|uniref:Uncharacterized protein n=1 Tax=Trichonephila inaurata madagascariensis TaxID=2747483 RepID=A0A8X6X9P1_9ARAC|nr:hypothetical protein TNIN_452331 [Trichonephila inaurata madagascariensis]GFY60076.1 hypothetical protein TNIN_73731 [Trichonephila inaurata madagascariensis]GFY73024.1 hypothetical protein TNIN_308141 [Trichonephila inaurata madagascariensis]